MRYELHFPNEAFDSHVKLWDTIRPAELAAAYLGLLKKQVEHSGGIDLVARLQAARLRGRAT